MSLNTNSYAPGRVAGGNHCSAQNDEREPVAPLTEAELLALDRQYEARKTEDCRTGGAAQVDHAHWLEVDRRQP